MKQITDYFRNCKMSTKLIAMAFSCIVISLLLALYSLYSVSRAYDRELYDTMANYLAFSASEIQYKLDDIQTMLRSIGQNETIQSYLAHSKDAGRMFNSEYNFMYSVLMDYHNENRSNNVGNILLKNDQFIMQTDTGATDHVPPAVYEKIEAYAEEAQGAIVCITDFSREYGLFFAKNIRRIDQLKLDTLGTLIVYVELDDLVHSCISLKQYDNMVFSIIQSQSSEILYTSDTSCEGNELLSINRNANWSVETLHGEKYFVTCSASSTYPWDYTCLVPYSDIYSSIIRALVICMAVFTVGGILLLVGVRFAVRNITEQFTKLIAQMDLFAQYTPDMELPVDEFLEGDTQRTDEIGMLNKHFSLMARKIDGLIQKDYASRILLREEQLKALEAQINPHFLYNRLNTINWRAKMYGATEISTMVEALSLLMRATLRDDGGIIPLAEELELVQSYIRIQSFRFEERLDFQQNIESEDLLQALIPKLTLHTLVENAIRYGVEESVGVCALRLTVFRDGCNVVIRVQNEGCLFEEGILEKLAAKTAQPRGHGIGLLNIRRRLEYAFRGQAGLKVYNTDGLATAEITVPFQDGNEDVL